MLTTSGRLLRLLALLQARRDWTAEELAERLEVTDRTVRRDVEKLRSLGYPVHATRGHDGGYRLGAGAALPPLLLDDDEAIAIAVGLRAAASGAVRGIEEATARALVKLEQVLPSRLRSRINALHGVTVSLVGAGPVVDAEILTAVAGAARDRQVLRLEYTSGGGSSSHRRVEPHRLLHSGHRWYVLAWDLDRDDWRTFRLDRVRPKTPVGPRFSARQLPEDNIAQYASYALSTRGYRYQATLTMSASAAEVGEHLPPSVATIEAIDEHTCSVTAGGHSLDEFVLYLGLLPMAFTVHSPPELIAHLDVVRDRLDRAGAASRAG